MKLVTVSKPDKRNTTTSKTIDDNVMSANCDITVALTIYGQFAARRKPDSRHMVYKTFSLTINFYLSKPGN